MTDTSIKYRGARATDGYRDAAVIAKAIREDIKIGRAMGDLPAGPWTASVTCEKYAGGQSVNIEIRDYDFAERREEQQEVAPGRFATVHPMTEQAKALHDALDGYRRAYNVDRSDVQTDYFDVTYYGSVTFETSFGRAQRLARAEAAKAKRARRAK